MSGLFEESAGVTELISPAGRRRPKQVSRQVSKRGPVGEKEIVASKHVEPEDLNRLLKSLARESCVHSWRNFDPNGSLGALLAWENRRRPTEIFFFYLEEAGERHLFAAGAVASRLKRDFPHPGFCVLGRCYIMPQFRGRGLYRSLLRYRLDHCRERFGGELRAIHIGSTDERIARVIRNHRIAGWPAFTHLGHEELTVANEVREVDAYLLMLPEYVGRVLSNLSGKNAPRSVVRLRNALSKIDRTELSDLGLLVKEALEEAWRQAWFEGRDPKELEQLLVFCRSIPLVGLS